jgi:AcrR family transcriptional regulator
MGRKSIAETRRDEILAAFERCVPKHGLDVSLEQIADEAGVKRSIIRHYVGNRDELVDALIERIATSYPQQFRAAAQDIPPSEMLARTLDYLFGSVPAYNEWDVVILGVLISAKERYPQAKQHLQRMFEEFVTMLAGDLALAYPAASRERCQHIAYSIFCLSMMNESMMWLGLDPAYNLAARQSAELLLRTLP